MRYLPIGATLALLSGLAMAGAPTPAQADVIAAGQFHTCALTSAGGVKCWGLNQFGQLGDGTTTDSPTPVFVKGLKSGVIAITAGFGHTCALTDTGGAKCWGQNQFGQLGDGTIANRSLPRNVHGLGSGVTAIAGGGQHTCALTSDGGVKCWGNNFHGQLGDGTRTTRSLPKKVRRLTSGVAAIAGGEIHTCALTDAGGVKCWGNNFNGQLGDGTKVLRELPGNVRGLTSGVVAIAAGGLHTCALTGDGDAKCWGYNFYGQVGDGTTTDRLLRVNVRRLTGGVAAITTGAGGTGRGHTCALTDAGGAKCWGWNMWGQLGDGTTTDHHTPAFVKGLKTGVAAIAAGADHTCALMSAGGAKCWGRNGAGQLGDGTIIDRHKPVNVEGF